MKFIRSKDWWLARILQEPDAPIGAGVDRTKQLEKVLADVVMYARTSGGTAGRDEGLCAACDRAETLLSKQPVGH